MKRAAFTGSYADLKFIKSRSVMQVIVELPIEQADAFLAAFKAPQPGAERPVALALLNSAPAVHAPASVPSSAEAIEAHSESAGQSGVASGRYPEQTGDRGRTTMITEVIPQQGPLAREKPQRRPTAAPDRLVQYVAIACGSPQFQEWLKGYISLPPDRYLDQLGAMQCVRQLLGVQSLAECSANPEARQKAKDLMWEYDVHIGKATEDRS